MPARKVTCRKSTNVVEVPEERTFVKPSAVSPHLSCPICQEVFVNPHRAPCGHTFCKGCIDPWLATNPICPVDRRPVVKGTMHHDFLIENIIGDYTVACPWRALGCDFIGPLHLLPSHKKSCLVNPALLPASLRPHTTALLRANSENMQTSLWSHLKKSISPPTSSRVARSATVSTTDSAISSLTSGDTDSNSQISVAACSSSSPSPSTSQPVNPAEAANESGLNMSEDEEEHLPPAPPPSLLFRLYHNSDTDSRDLLCNFLDNSAIPAPSPVAKRRRRR